MRMLAAVTMATVGLGCSSSSDGGGGPACGDISGNYSVQSSRVSGSCDAALDGDGKSTFSISRADGNTWTIVLPGISGGCPATLDDACKLTSNCELSGAGGALIGTVSVEYTFSGRTFSGSSVNAIKPPAVPAACTANYSDSGSKL